MTRAPTNFAREPVRRVVCTARVPDNGDCDECGREPLRSHRCIEPLQAQVRELAAERKRRTEPIAAIDARLRELQTESG